MLIVGEHSTTIRYSDVSTPCKNAIYPVGEHSATIRHYDYITTSVSLSLTAVGEHSASIRHPCALWTNAGQVRLLLKGR